MRKTLIISVLFSIVVFISAFFPLYADEQIEEKAVSASLAWLQLVDDGQYGASWDSASVLFKRAVEKEQWRRQLSAVRGPLGALKSRKLMSKQFTTSLPGAPDGKYVVIQYETSFEKKRLAIETITSMLDQDGTWRVAGYFIK